MLSGAATSSGEDKLKKVKDKLKKSFDKCDVNDDGVLDREEMKAGCLVMAKSIAKMSGQPVDRILPNIERELDHFLDVTSPDGGKISFDAMLAVALPGLCQGEDPAEFFSKMDDCMFTTIDMNIDMYMGGLLKDGDLEKVNDTPFYCMCFLCPEIGTDLPRRSRQYTPTCSVAYGILQIRPHTLKLQVSYIRSLRPHTIVGQGLIHKQLNTSYTRSFRPPTLEASGLLR